MNKRIKPLIYFIGLFFIALPLWINKYFGSAGVEQLLFTFKFGLKGALTSDPVFVKRFIKWCIIGPAILTALLLVLENNPISNLLRKLSYGSNQKTALGKNS